MRSSTEEQAQWSIEIYLSGSNKPINSGSAREFETEGQWLAKFLCSNGWCVVTKLIGSRLTRDLYERLNGSNLEACAEKAILICSVDTDGWAHPAMLSYFEVVAKDQSNIRLAAYKDSCTTNNMRRNGKLTLLIIDERLAYYIKGTVQELSPQMRCLPHNAKLNLRVEQLLADEANEEFEPGSYILTGVTYKRRNDLAKVRVMLEELLT